eukprot:3083138-Rhodomonas_salina.3
MPGTDIAYLVPACFAMRGTKLGSRFDVPALEMLFGLCGVRYAPTGVAYAPTDVTYAPTDVTYAPTDVAYDPTYCVCSYGLAYDPTDVAYAVTDIAYAVTDIALYSYAMSGTDLGYAPTRLLGVIQPGSPTRPPTPAPYYPTPTRYLPTRLLRNVQN